MLATNTEVPQPSVILLESEYYPKDPTNLLRTRKTLRQIVRHADRPRLVVDMSQARFFDSELIGLLLEIRHEVCRSQGSFVICSPSPFAQAILDELQLKLIIPVYPTRDDAVASTC